MKTYYKPGSWNAICDLCGFKFKAEELKLRWDGARVCKDDFELRHPADFIKIPSEQAVPPWTRPEPADSFIDSLIYLITEAGDYLTTEDSSLLTWE